MLVGYFYILAAAVFWGSAVVFSKYLGTIVTADALLLSQARVTFAWIILMTFMVTARRGQLVINYSDLWRFGLLGVIGFAGANFLLYYSFKGMDVAVADLIQFTAPAIVVAWMAILGKERLDPPKLVALVLSLIGCGLALGVLDAEWRIAAPVYFYSAAASALCYAFLLIWGKSLSGRYSMLTFLHYALLGATLFWCTIVPPWDFVSQLIAAPARAGMLVGFGIMSVLAPYICFFTGLKRISASRAGIVSTFEPVVVAIGGALFLGEHLGLWQLIGIGLVLAAIILLELTSGKYRDS